jgi:hypothetical protein
MILNTTKKLNSGTQSFIWVFFFILIQQLANINIELAQNYQLATQKNFEKSHDQS